MFHTSGGDAAATVDHAVGAAPLLRDRRLSRRRRRSPAGEVAERDRRDRGCRRRRRRPSRSRRPSCSRRRTTPGSTTRVSRALGPPCRCAAHPSCRARRGGSARRGTAAVRDGRAWPERTLVAVVAVEPVVRAAPRWKSGSSPRAACSLKRSIVAASCAPSIAELRRRAASRSAPRRTSRASRLLAARCRDRIALAVLLVEDQPCGQVDVVEGDRVELVERTAERVVVRGLVAEPLRRPVHHQRAGVRALAEAQAGARRAVQLVRPARRSPGTHHASRMLPIDAPTGHRHPLAVAGVRGNARRMRHRAAEELARSSRCPTRTRRWR